MPESFFQDDTPKPLNPAHPNLDFHGRGDAGLKSKDVQRMEKQLLELQMEQNRLIAEFDRIPDNAKTIV